VEIFPLCSLENTAQAMEVCSLLWTISFRALSAVAGAEQPPRRAPAEPEARHVGCFLRREVVPRLVPGPRESGAGKQNAGDDGFRWSPPARGRRRVSGCAGVSVVRAAASLKW